MKLAILSTAPHCYSTRRLRAAAHDRGHTVKVLNTLKFSMTIEKESPELFFRNRRLSSYDDGNRVEAVFDAIPYTDSTSESQALADCQSIATHYKIDMVWVESNGFTPTGN